MSPREITLHSFCSAKGGVGKTTLAVASAVLLAKANHKVVLIDADLTGTSLADGLRLVAPKLHPLGQDRLDLDAPSLGEPYGLEETFERRRERSRLVLERGERFTGEALCIPFFNDALAYQSAEPERECRIDAMLWRHQQEDGVLYLPSSSLLEDASLALGWLYGQDSTDLFLQRFCWLLDELISRLTNLTDIVIDLPPGLLGVTRQILRLVRILDDRNPLPEGYPQWEDRVSFRVNPILVMTPDRNDWLTAIEFYVRYRDPLVPRLNRATSNQEAEETIAEICKEMGLIGPALSKVLDYVPYVPTLSRLFRKHTGQLELDPALNGLTSKLRLGALA